MTELTDEQMFEINKDLVVVSKTLFKAMIDELEKTSDSISVRELAKTALLMNEKIIEFTERERNKE